MNLARVVKGVRQVGRIPEVFAAAGATAAWMPLTAAYLGAANLQYPYIVRFRGGQMLKLDTFADLQTVWRICFFGEYPVQGKDRRIIDAGANCGFFTLYAAMQAPQARIASIEPFPATFQRLQQTVSDNRLGDRATLFEAALFGSEGQTHIDSREEIGSQFRRVGTEGLAVESITLDTVLDRCAWDEVDLFKLDVEGSEFEILLGARAQTIRRIRRIVMEFHPRYDQPTYTPQMLADYLEAHAFRITLRRDDGEGYGIIHAQAKSAN